MGRFSRLETGDPAAAADAARDESASASPDCGATAESCLEQGDRALFSQDARGALRFYSKAMESEQRRLDAWVRMIFCLLIDHRLDEASPWIGRALVAYPEDSTIMALRGVEQAARGQLKQAMTSSDQAMKRGAAEPLVQLARGLALLHGGNGNAYFCFDQAAKLAPEDWKVPMLAGMILKSRGLIMKAVAFFSRASEADDRNPLPWFQMGLCRAQTGQRGAALRALTAASQLCEPDDPLQQQIRNTSPGNLWRWVCCKLGLG